MKHTNGNDFEAASQNVLGQVGALLDATARQHNAGTLTDPAPSDQELALRRMVELLAQVSDGAVAELRRLRDDVDACIRSIQVKHGELTNDFQHHAECVAESMRFRAIASEHLDNVRSRFALPTQGKQQQITTGN